jgi:hypothetical protein
VIGGPGAFMVVAEKFEQFADAILKKLIIEIAANDRVRRNAGAGFDDAGVVRKTSLLSR